MYERVIDAIYAKIITEVCFNIFAFFSSQENKTIRDITRVNFKPFPPVHFASPLPPPQGP